MSAKSYLRRLRAAYYSGLTAVAPSPALQLAELLATGFSTALSGAVNLGTDATPATVTVEVGDYLVCFFGSRHGPSTRSHNSLTPSTWACSFSKQVEDEQYDTAADGHIRLSCWQGVVTTGGTGGLVGATQASTYQRGLILLRIPGAASIAQTALGKSETGTTDSVAWNATPNAAGLVLAAGAYESNPGPTVADVGSIDGSTVTPSSGFRMRAFQKLSNPPSPLAFAAAGNDRARVLGALNLLGA